MSEVEQIVLQLLPATFEVIHKYLAKNRLTNHGADTRNIIDNLCQEYGVQERKGNNGKIYYELAT